jgi:4-amino-4-deoxy-L-arabinose transferase-like glycosyltransferase
VVLPVALKAVVRGWDFLYITFGPTQMDYIADVPLVGGDPLGFLGRYVELSPTLSLHSSTHPPGSILLLWLVENIFGAGPVPATWAVIVLGSLGVLAAFWLALHLGGRHAALLAGALWVAMPGHQIYSVTSMDSVFNGIMALGMVAFFLALEPDAKPWRAALAGALIALALFFTYAATQLFFFGAAVCVLALARQRRLLPVLRQGAIAAGVLVLLYVLLYLATGFNVIEGAVQATDNNATMLGKPVAGAGAGLFVPPSMEQYLYYLVVNLVPFAWYIAPWGLAAFVPVVVAGTRAWPRPDRWHTLALALVVLVLGMVLAGLFNREVERIWSFVYPLAAVVMVRHIWQGDTPRERVWRAGLWVSLFFAQSAVMRMLLNTYW